MVGVVLVGLFNYITLAFSVRRLFKRLFCDISHAQLLFPSELLILHACSCRRAAALMRVSPACYLAPPAHLPATRVFRGERQICLRYAVRALPPCSSSPPSFLLDTCSSVSACFHDGPSRNLYSISVSHTIERTGNLNTAAAPAA